MKEILEAIMSAIEAQDAKIKAMEKAMEAAGVDIGDIVDVMYAQHDKSEFDAFSGRHGSKFEPVVNDLKVLVGDDYDPVRQTYDKVKELSGQEGFSEDEYVDGVLAEVVQKLNTLKGALPPEAQPALEQAEQAVQEAAVANDQGEGITGEDAEEAVNDSPGEWSEEMLEKEKGVGKKLYE